MQNTQSGLQFHLHKMAVTTSSIGCVFAVLALYLVAVDILGELLIELFYQMFARSGVLS